MKNFIFEELLPFNYQLIKNEFYPKFPLQQFQEALLNGAIYYPSSGVQDINHLFYLNKQVIPQIDIELPDVYIHSDSFHCYDHFKDYPHLYPDYIWNTINDSFHFKTLNNIKFYSTQKNIEIFQLERPNSTKPTWIICFWGYLNEDVLKTLINKNIKIPIVIDKVDGISEGMGGSDETNGRSIAVIHYPFLAKELGLKFIVSLSNHITFNRLEESLKSVSKIAIDRLSIINELLKYEREDLQSLTETAINALIKVETIKPNPGNFYYLKTIL